MTEEQREQFREMRRVLDNHIRNIAGDPGGINNGLAIIRAWKPGAYGVGDVRVYEGIPYRCVQRHDSTNNPAWTPYVVPTLWAQYHGTTHDTARPWVAPTGAHDTYKAGEFMVWQDGKIYRCAWETVYSPAEAPSAWEVSDGG